MLSGKDGQNLKKKFAIVALALCLCVLTAYTLMTVDNNQKTTAVLASGLAEAPEELDDVTADLTAATAANAQLAKEKADLQATLKTMKTSLAAARNSTASGNWFSMCARCLGTLTTGG